MKMTNGEMWDSIQTLSAVKETGKLGYACARNLRKLMGEAREFMDTRDRLLAEYGEDQGNGKFVIPPEKVAAFTADLSEYSAIEHEVGVMTVSEDVFCSGGLTTKEMYALGWMVKEDGNERTGNAES